MASPISFGDVYLMGTLALRLGRAFTKGRKSAPAEFREVEHQLYSLSAALCALRDASASSSAALSVDTSQTPATSQPRQTSNGETIGTMLQSCEETLKHLEAIVEKYSCLGEPRDPQKPLFKRWSRDLRITWRKIAWTAEGGDLSTLRSQLTLHTNTLNLILGVAINSQTKRVENQVDQVVTMLKEIHEWFVNNLKDTTSPSRPLVQDTQDPEPGPIAVSQDFNFELLADTGRGESPEIICHNASLHPKWKVNNSEVSPRHLFMCKCNDNCQDCGWQLHQTRVTAYALSPLSFPLKIIGKERSWMLYKATDTTNNRLVSLIIKRIPLRGMSAFEETFIHDLAITRAAAMLRRGLNTMLAYSDPNTRQERALNLMGDLSNGPKSLDAITFSTGGRSYVRSSIEAMQLLHYQSFCGDYLGGNPPTPENLLSNTYLDSAEVVIFYGEQDSQAAGDVSRTILQLKYNNILEIDRKEGTVTLNNVQCTGWIRNGQTNDVNSLDVTFQFTKEEAAEHFYNQVDEMRMELFVMGLQHPRKDERVVLKLQAGQVQSEEIHISDADISIVQNATTERYRLIITSRNGCSILSQELAENFLSPLSTPGGRPNFASRTYLVQIEDSGKREVYRYKRGFEYLDFSTVQTDRLFELGLATIAGSLPIRTIEPAHTDD